MKWEKSIKALLKILENPLVENGYEELKNFYKDNKMNYEKESLEYLINIKFKNANNSDISKK
jgi:hypothetical protein